MRHRVAGRHLGRDTAHRTALYRNLVTDLMRYERITTTEAKAKEIRPMAEKMVTFARRGDLHARRLASRFMYDQKVVKRLFDEIGPRMRDRPGGYLRITKLEPRKGDGARMATIEFVDYGGAAAVAMPRPQRVTAAPAGAPAATRMPTAPAPAPEPPAAEAFDEPAAGDLLNVPEAVADEGVVDATIESAEDAATTEAGESEAAGDERTD